MKHRVVITYEVEAPDARTAVRLTGKYGCELDYAFEQQLLADRKKAGKPGPGPECIVTDIDVTCVT